MTTGSHQSTRRFTRSGPPFEVPPKKMEKLCALLSPDGVLPDEVIARMEEAMSDAHSFSLLQMDSTRFVTKEGRKELARIASIGRELANAIRGASDEARHFLDVCVRDNDDESAILAGKLKRSCLLHTQAYEKRRSPKQGAPEKLVAGDLADELAPIWAQYSGRKWSHRGAWGAFVKEAFELAGIDDSGRQQARLAAVRYSSSSERIISRRFVATRPLFQSDKS